MRQRNNTGQPLTVHTSPPQVVGPGETVDHDTYIVGLTAVNDEAESRPEPASEAASVKTSKASDKEAGK